jgi:hypothetical protein
VAKFAATDFDISIGGTDFSDSLAAVTLDISRESLDTTSFGNTARTFIGGLESSTVTFSFHQDFAADAVDSTIFAALGTIVEVIIKPQSGTVSASNPTYTFSVLVTQSVPFSSNVGDLATMDVSYPVSGDVVRAVAA